ncbi:hypothetical protein FKM82_017613 [Ascaphus truei]
MRSREKAQGRPQRDRARVGKVVERVRRPLGVRACAKEARTRPQCIDSPLGTTIPRRLRETGIRCLSVANRAGGSSAREYRYISRALLASVRQRRRKE